MYQEGALAADVDARDTTDDIQKDSREVLKLVGNISFINRTEPRNANGGSK